MKSVKEWNQLDFNFPSQQDRQNAIDNGLFVQANAFPIDMDVDYNVNVERTRIFVTIPRFSTGIPVTLGTVAPTIGALIQPYPDYSWHSSHGANCDGITSVLRIAIDECRRLWVLDTGKIGDIQKCPPQLLVFDLSTNLLISRYRFPKQQYSAASLFITPIVDVKTCANTKVYIADVTGFSLIVYDALNNRSWRVKNKLFSPSPAHSTHTIAGESFELMDGLFGMALPKRCDYDDDNRSLYFHAYASDTEHKVSLNVLNNPSLWLQNDAASPSSFITLGKRSSPSAAEAIDSNGNLFFGMDSPSVIACWNTANVFNKNNVKYPVRNDVTLQFVSGMKVIKNIYGEEELWVVSNRFQKVFKETLNNNEINFRLQARKVTDILGGALYCN
ncbi:unnamed protein product [Diamesa serratosioi]